MSEKPMLRNKIVWEWEKVSQLGMQKHKQGTSTFLSTVITKHIMIIYLRISDAEVSGNGLLRSKQGQDRQGKQVLSIYTRFFYFEENYSLSMETLNNSVCCVKKL